VAAIVEPLDEEALMAILTQPRSAGEAVPEATEDG